MKKQRKHYTPEEKVAILRRHLLEQVPISELCDKHGLQPTVFYRWQKEFFENGTAAFERLAVGSEMARRYIFPSSGRMLVNITAWGKDRFWKAVNIPHASSNPSAASSSTSGATIS